MKILLVEDLGSVSEYLVEALREQGHEVLEAGDIDDARSFWEDEGETIDCLIVDLNMDPAGLDDTEIEATRGGLLTGWVWLTRHVFADDPDMRRRTIIYTDYLGKLEEHVKEADLAKVFRVAKSGRPTDHARTNRGVGAAQLMEYVRRIARLPLRGK